uniref:RING-type domain-containing protein n=1 Tax=Glossina pallidipes TaxID=7398 RepID=A0A1A9ZIK4_GLOPL
MATVASSDQLIYCLMKSAAENSELSSSTSALHSNNSLLSMAQSNSVTIPREDPSGHTCPSDLNNNNVQQPQRTPCAYCLHNAGRYPLSTEDHTYAALRFVYSTRSVPSEISRSRIRLIEHSDAISCAVCLDELELGSYVIELLCKHIFHELCIAEWLRLQKICPLCRSRCSNT